MQLAFLCRSDRLQKIFLSRGRKQFYLKFDSSDNLYLADTGDHKIYKITPQGTISTFAGSTVGDQDSN